MLKSLIFIACSLCAWHCSANAVFISEKTITATDADKFGFHRLISGESDSWDDSWIIFIYPEVNAKQNMASEVCMDINEGAEKLATSCTDIKSSGIQGFNRSDIEVSKHRPVSVDISITYGSDRYLVKNVGSLPGKDYETFKKRYNK